MPDTPTSPSTIARPRADILVIDDTPENLHLLSTMLSDRGYKVRSVTKGTTGIRGAIAAPPDLILLDINMPEVNGYEVCAQLKNNEITCDIPVIFISALGDVFDKVKAFDVGGVDFITKPFQIEEVLARMQSHLTIRRLQQQQTAQNIQLQQEINQRRRAEETFEKAFLSSPSPIAIATLEQDKLIAVNPSFLRMSGYSQGDVIGKTTTELSLWRSPETYTAVIAQATTIPSSADATSDNKISSYELDCQTHSGHSRTVLVSIERIVLRDQPCALMALKDITERKRLENEFISVVSHELRTPMHSLIGALDLLNTGELGELTDQGRKILSLATTNAERLILLVNDILDLERLKSGKVELNKNLYSIDMIFGQAVNAMQVMADQVEIKMRSQSIPISVNLDRDRILQTLTNLLSNAIKFSPAGSTVQLAATLDSKDNKSSEASHLHITVKDEGRGIPSDQLETIFERFQQVDASDSRKKGGTGLGLAICRNIIQQHNGRIWVESQLNHGSTFHILLPIG
ncbi:MAG: ATP-binding protein [Phormidesmis sp.]